jgi:hypothetical protein
MTVVRGFERQVLPAKNSWATWGKTPFIVGN